MSQALALAVLRQASVLGPHRTPTLDLSELCFTCLGQLPDYPSLITGQPREAGGKSHVMLKILQGT